MVIHEVGEHDGHPYMVLEYLEGLTLRQWPREHTAAASTSGQRVPVPPGRAVELILPVVRALAYAHERGIVHRDLKPENVMITRSGSIKVLDFGIAKLLVSPRHDGEGSDSAPGGAGDVGSGLVSGQAGVLSSALIGTLPYMSPEQMNAGVIDHRSDVWTVGIMLFELVTGRHPISGHSLSELMRVADEDAPMPGVLEAMPDAGPELVPLAGVIERCLIKDLRYRTPSARVLLAELEALASGRRPVLLGDDGSPFAGLAAFQEADADRFFGRDREIDQVVNELRSRPLVAVVGPSGAGKSSLVRAGVIPALKRSGEGWDAHVVRPGREPLAALAATIGILAPRHGSSSEPGQTDGKSSDAALGDSAASAVLGPLVERLRAEPGYLGARLRARATSKLRRMVVFVDQLEELYTLGAPPDDRAAFLACLAGVADDAAAPLRVIVSMRSDFLDRLAEDRRLGPEVTRGLVLLPPMDPDGMRQALLRPVEAAEHRFASPALVERMVEALASTPGALPLLQFTAARLWELRDTERRLLTEASYERLGGVAGALAMHADAVLAGVSPAQKTVARAVLERLVMPERTRALVSVAELRALHSDSGAVDDMVQHLAAMRLVAIERGEEGEGQVVELVHESLIDRWPTLARWLADNLEDAAFLARLRSAAQEWSKHDRDEGLLWRGAPAQEARLWHEHYRGELPARERAYLDAVLALADRAVRVRRRLFGGILSAALAVAIAMAWLAWKQTEAREEANALARREADSRQVAAEQAAKAALEATRARDAIRMAALRALPEDPTTQLALLREIEQIASPPPGAAQEAKRTLYADVASAVLTGHDDSVWSAVFSPDMRRIVSASRDRTVRVWNADGTGEPLVLRGHEHVVRSAGFSPDGKRIVSASWDKTVRVWNADGSGEPLVLRGHDHAVYSAAFSADGRRIVSASYDGTVRVWNADGSGEPLVLRGHGDAVYSAAFSADGRRIVSTSKDRTVRIWNADGSGEPLVLRGHGDAVYSAAFSADGQRIASASQDRTVRVWNADGSGAPLILRHDDAVLSMAFSPDGQRIASASLDKTVRLWNSDGSGKSRILRGHQNEIYSVAFGPDGQHIVSASVDKTVRVWNTARSGSEPLILDGHGGEVTSAGFSPDGRRVVSASQDKTVRVWNADGSGEPLVLRGHGDAVYSAMFSPDGQRIVSTSLDRTVRVWNANGSGEPLVLRGHDDWIWSTAFSPDGRRIVSASKDRTVRVWNADGSGEPLVLRGHEDSVSTAAFSPDGRRIVSASHDNTVRVWNADGSGEPLVLRGYDDWVTGAEFSPDGRYILSVSRDKTIRIWQADGMGEPIVLLGHDLWVNKASFSPDSRRIVSASDDRTVRVWYDLAPIALDDPRLWRATSYCMPITYRMELLGVTEETARQDRLGCIDRVVRVRRAQAELPPF